MHDVTTGVESSLPPPSAAILQESETLGNQVTPTSCSRRGWQGLNLKTATTATRARRHFGVKTWRIMS
ncbi:hypothetical protein HZH66_004639 [Vespula vulgaris]|uniref:Uncharacterized protein n=1 Tax=Vespula vulgaris TaxID=7454 RepID=A0A834KAJ1_VESVU|nr:hypothetical protein HZH66_004639 [Vespula vulgaris]